ncbi:MAG: cysteine peptidase family C39 domain-containing protein [Bacilli bacterium]|nr:cysteine peptidase family C39 domain-containing protein [Bacilli bacterium]
MNILVSQTTHNGCAVSCLDMILIANGINLESHKMHFLIGENPILSLQDIIERLHFFNINSKAYYVKSKKIVDIYEFKNVLIHDHKHYYLIERVNNEQYRIFDPARMHTFIRKSRYIERHWDGYCLVFELKGYQNPLFARYPRVPFQIKLIIISSYLFILLFFYLMTT